MYREGVDEQRQCGDAKSQRQHQGTDIATAAQCNQQPEAEDLLLQCIRGEGVAALGVEQDGDGGERLEDVEQLLVGGVVGQEVAEVDEPEAGRGPGERGAPPAGDADVLRRVLGGEAAPVGPVVVRSDGLAQLPQPGQPDPDRPDVA